ncbi:MAG: protein translocase subunit SecF [Acidobacteria bacterium]|nr:protein translocase subunit SecF [Acidobacteriota bacterium]
MIELLPTINVDWLGKRRLFFGISALLIGVGLVSILSKGRLRYGVDFQGGTVVTVRFQGQPEDERIRQVLRDAGLQNPVVQALDAKGAGKDVLIQLEMTAADEADLGRGREIVTEALNKNFQNQFEILGSESVGPKAGEDLRQQAVFATAYALGGILIYMAFRFEWIYGTAAVFAVFHDVLVTLGLFSLTDRQIDLTVVAALLTLVGVSVNDTIVIFDRVRENVKIGRREPLEKSLNDGINQTMGRTVITAGLTFLALFALFFFGGEGLENFAFALLVGQMAGTYSTVAIAAPLVLIYRNFKVQQPAAAVAGTAKVKPLKAK